MIVPVMAISNLVLTRQIYSEETNGAHAHNRDRVPLISLMTQCDGKSNVLQSNKKCYDVLFAVALLLLNSQIIILKWPLRWLVWIF